MIRINDSSCMQQFVQTIPGASGRGRDYLKVIAQRILDARFPVTLAKDDMVQARTLGAVPLRECLVVRPTNAKLRKRYPAVHFASAWIHRRSFESG